MHLRDLLHTPDLIQKLGFAAREAGLALGLAVVLGGALGIAVGAYLSDRIARLPPWGGALIIPIGFVLGAPAIFTARHPHWRGALLLPSLATAEQKTSSN
jgi:hypothetical protein